MLKVPTHQEILQVDRSAGLMLVVDDRTTTPGIDVLPDPTMDKSKPFRVVKLTASTDPDVDVHDKVNTLPTSPVTTLEVSRDFFDRLQRHPEDVAILLRTEREMTLCMDNNGLVGRGILPKIDCDEEGWYCWETEMEDVQARWEQKCIESGHEEALDCGWEGKEKPCSKEEQYTKREQAAFMLATAALETKPMNMLEMLAAIDAVPKEQRRAMTVHGQHLNGMYKAMKKYMGEDFEPWEALEGHYGHYLDKEGGADGAAKKRARIGM